MESDAKRCAPSLKRFVIRDNFQLSKWLRLSHVLKWKTNHLAGSEPHHIAEREVYDQNELLLWVLMTGLFSAEGEHEELWFLMRAAYVAERHLGIKDLDGLKDVMARHLYSKPRQERSLIVVGLHLSSH